MFESYIFRQISAK